MPYNLTKEPVGNRKFPSKSLRQWLIEAVIAHGDSDECLPWPWNLNGKEGGLRYGMVREHGRMQTVTRVAYKHFVGPLPDGVLACHTCDNPPCFNPKHLFPGSYKDNEQDKKAKMRHVYGMKHSLAKLTDAQVIEMRRLAHIMTRQALADRYGVGLRHVFKILRKELWPHI
jgi:hypothetical protein